MAKDKSKFKLFEVTAAGFDASSDETDDLVFWVSADSAEMVKEVIKDTGATFSDEVPQWNLTDADFTLPGQAMNLSAALLKKASDHRNKNRAPA